MTIVSVLSFDFVTHYSLANMLTNRSRNCRQFPVLLLLMVILVGIIVFQYIWITSLSRRQRMSPVIELDNLFLVEPNKVYSFTKRLSKEEEARIASRATWGAPEWNTEAERVLQSNRVHENIVMVALANNGMKETLMNWIASLELTGHRKWVVLCFDFPIYSFLANNGYADNAVMVPRDWIHKEITSDEAKWEQPLYVDLLQAKILIIIRLLKLKIRLFYLDIDLVFCSPYVLDHLLFDDIPRTDVLFMVDSITAEKTNYMSMVKLSLPSNYAEADLTINNSYIDGGFFLAQPSERIINVFEEVFNLTTTGGVLIDQTAMNLALNSAAAKYGGSISRALDKLLYPSGWVIKRRDKNRAWGILPLVVHMNSLIGNAEKKAAFKSFGLWFVGETPSDSKI